jgi:hypothetical protein
MLQSKLKLGALICFSLVEVLTAYSEGSRFVLTSEGCLPKVRRFVKHCPRGTQVRPPPGLNSRVSIKDDIEGCLVRIGRLTTNEECKAHADGQRGAPPSQTLFDVQNRTSKRISIAWKTHPGNT